MHVDKSFKKSRQNGTALLSKLSIYPKISGYIARKSPHIHGCGVHIKDILNDKHKHEFYNLSHSQLCLIVNLCFPGYELENGPCCRRFLEVWNFGRSP